MKGIFVYLLYGFVLLPEVRPEQLYLAVCVQTIANWEGPLCLVHQVYIFEITDRSSLGCGEQSAAKGIFIHLLYGSVRLPEVGLKQLYLAVCV